MTAHAKHVSYCKDDVLVALQKTKGLTLEFTLCSFHARSTLDRMAEDVEEPQCRHQHMFDHKPHSLDTLSESHACQQASPGTLWD